MDQGIGTGDPVARRARRRARWWGTAAGTAPGVPAARPAADRADDWFDSWLSDSAAGAGTRRALEHADGWTTLTDLHRPGSASATIDLVAVGPGGIVVVETLHWDGDITVAGGTLRHRGYGRTPDVAAVAATAGALTALLAPTHRRTVQAVLCLAARDHDPVAVCGGGTVVGEAQLAAHLAALPERLPSEDVALVVEYLTAELGGPTSPEQLTVDDVFRPAAVWAAPAEPAPSAARRVAAVEGTTLDSLVSDDAAPYVQPGNDRPAGLHEPGQDPDDARTVHETPRPARGDGALRLGVLLLSLATVGNVLLAWIDAAG
jgi:hypothetical protein